jgi:hypothetical protein
MAAPRQVVDLAIGRKELAELRSIARSRSEPAARVERARMILAYLDDPSFFAVGRALGVHAPRRCSAVSRERRSLALWRHWRIGRAQGVSRRSR